MALYTTPVFNINLKKLAANYRLLEKLSAPAIPAAVVKDDAYGLGAAEVAAALYAAAFLLPMVRKAKKSALSYPMRKYMFYKASVPILSLIFALPA